MNKHIFLYCILLGMCILSVSGEVKQSEHANMNQVLKHFIRPRSLPDAMDLGNYDDSSEQDTNCTRLPPHSARTSVSLENQVSFLNLLNGAYDHLVNVGRHEDVVLLVGNSGVGKTSLTQILAGDMNRVHAVLTHANKMVIVDDRDKISAPNTVSKTLVPELVIKAERSSQTTVAFYDCPGFDDTRGAAQDVATSFFMNEVVKKVKRVKLLFLVLHSSVDVGNDKLDFRLLATHATKFVKNLSKFKNSIGLVVTKVKNYDHRGKLRSDKSIMKNILSFLATYNATLHESLSLPSNIEDNEKKIMISKQIEFVKILLQKDSEGRYNRIAFSRDPEKCGPLSGSLQVNGTKARVTKLYEGLEYGNVGNSTENFGFTPKIETVLKISSSYFTQVNSLITQKISALTANFKTWFDTIKISQITNPVSAVPKLNDTMQHTCTEMNKLIKGLGKEKADPFSASPAKIGRAVQSSLKTMGYAIPENFQTFMEKQEAVLVFFDRVVGSNKLERRANDWINPVLDLQVHFSEYQSWYAFCMDLQNILWSFDFNTKKVFWASNRTVWLDFIKQNKIMVVGHHIQSLGNKFGQQSRQMKLLNDMMRYGLQATNTTCVNHTLIVQGHFVRFTEFINASGNIRFPVGCLYLSNVIGLTVEVYAANTVFIDSDLDAVGLELNLVLISPTWQVVGDRQLILNGRNAENIFPMNATSGNFSLFQKGTDGNDGLPGKAGGSAGSLFGLAGQVLNANKLEISANGGHGGNAQNGGNGGNGSQGRWPSYGDTNSDSYFNIIILSTEKRLFRGHPGYPGGRGGDGGVGGFGGLPGYISITSYERSAKAVKKSLNRGNNGTPGKGGQAGQGGLPGNAYTCDWFRFLIFPVTNQCWDRTSYLPRAANGTHGIYNSSYSGIEFPPVSKYKIDDWENILSFKAKYYNLLSFEISNFIDKELQRLKLVSNNLKVNQEWRKVSDEIEARFFDALTATPTTNITEAGEQDNKNWVSFKDVKLPWP